MKKNIKYVIKGIKKLNNIQRNKLQVNYIIYIKI